jgi:hypothetical protein
MADPDLLDAYTELFVIEDDGDGKAAVRWECSRCDRDVTDQPCPEHAPLTDLPGLRLVECTAEPRHYTWVHQRDDYGVPCYACLYTEAREAEMAQARCPHRWWNKTGLWRRWVRFGYSAGFIAGSGMSWSATCDGCCEITRFGRSSYLLGISRDTWQCWRKGHRRGEDAGIGGPCAKCAPWPCCGSERYDHRDGCAEVAA